MSTMKRIFSILVLLAIIAIAPSSASAKFRWGATAGVNINSLKFKQDIVSIGSTIGYAAGIQGELMFPGIGFGVDFGIGYDQQGAKVNLGEKLIWSSLGYGNEQVYLHNIHIPIHLKFKYTRLNGIENKIYPFVFGGPSINILLAHSDGGNMAYTTTSLGMHVGFGVELMRKFQISASHEWGLSQQFKTILLEDNAHKLRTWHIRCTYFF